MFNWADVPQNQRVPLRRAIFDRGGYQLYDTVGETIVVPFANQNLYVMKFGLSDDGTTYFVNAGDAPVLYVPRGAYLENASVPGARWYPFPQNYDYVHPVFLGIAPSWNDYCDMGWYPHTYFYGGYFCERPFFSVGFVRPLFGLFIEFGGHHFDGWDHYHDYDRGHEAPYHVTVVNNYVYNQGGRPGFAGRPFEGGNSGYRAYGRTYPGGRSAGGDRGYSNGRPIFQGSGRPSEGGRTEGRTYGSGTHTYDTSGGHVFRGTGSYGEARPTQGSPTFGGRTYGTPNTGGETGTHTFRGGGGSYGNGADRTYGNGGGSASGGGRPVFSGGDRPSGGGRSYGGDSGRVFSGGGSTPSNGRVFSGGGDRSYGGGGRPSSSERPVESSRPSGNGGGRSSGDSGGRSSGDSGGRSSGGFYRGR